MPADPAIRRSELADLRREAEACTRCPLHESRNQVVFGVGNPEADLMFIGEAPGAEEDRTGLPFVGRSGGLLDQLLDGIGISRDEVFIANVVKCRPPDNRDPVAAEIDACSPYLERQVELIAPRVVCTLGNFATKLLSGDPSGITKVHGEPRPIEVGTSEVTLFPLFHPAAALRSPKYASGLRGDFARIPELLAADGTS
jgi:uracil-DNA glycosylase